MHKITLFKFKKSYLCVLILTVSTYCLTLLLALFFKPAPLANILGFLALLTYITTLTPSIFKTLFPKNKVNKVIGHLVTYRRYIGITAFFLGANHGLILIIQKPINLLEFQTYFEYFPGICILFIFTLLTITSNDWSVRKMKKTWKKLHRLTYCVIFLLPWHILDKMSANWSYITPLAVLLSFSTIFIFLIKNLKIHLNIDGKSNHLLKLK